MIDHSDANRAFLTSGELDKITAHPSGGWMFIQDLEAVYSSFGYAGVTGFALTTTDDFNVYGMFSGPGLSNTSGPAYMLKIGDSCSVVMAVDGKAHSTTSAAIYGHAEGNPTTETWARDGIYHREGGLAHVTEWDAEGRLAEEAWYPAGSAPGDGIMRLSDKVHSNDSENTVTIRRLGDSVSAEIPWFEVHKNGSLFLETYRLSDTTGRDVHYYPSGRMKSDLVGTSDGGEITPESRTGPALTTYRTDGTVESTTYIVNAITHHDQASFEAAGGTGWIGLYKDGIRQ